MPISFKELCLLQHYGAKQDRPFLDAFSRVQIFSLALGKFPLFQSYSLG